jgi:aspartate aminotransferase, cytoplasmic
VCKARQLVPFFHLAYQGLSSGNLDLDAWAVRYFVHEAQHELFVAQSLSTNFNLYNERIGHLVGVFDSYQIAYRCRTQLTTIVRRNYSNPPAHGAFVVATILTNPTLYGEWKNNLRAMHDRIQSTRHLFCSRLKQLGAPGSWEHIVQQTGEPRAMNTHTSSMRLFSSDQVYLRTPVSIHASVNY